MHSGLKVWGIWVQRIVLWTCLLNLLGVKVLGPTSLQVMRTGSRLCKRASSNLPMLYGFHIPDSANNGI